MIKAVQHTGLSLVYGDESCDISGLKVLGLDEFVTGSWKNKQKTQRRPVEAGQEPSDGEVSLLSDFVNWKSQKNQTPYSFIGVCLYSMREAVTCLVTVPTVGESKRLGGNFRNWRISLFKKSTFHNGWTWLATVCSSTRWRHVVASLVL